MPHECDNHFPTGLGIFDVPPRIAAKLYRCNEIARVQRCAPDADLWTEDDRAILERQPLWDGNYYLYWRNLNA